ncbi:MAG: sugar MFS transporter [Microscillaceae bacterium]|nr:sugar MFS transporter [Microscillaceae bacterium]MDW8461495.1 sugar MFS transporter [Cytophagales bacterium]
MTSFSTNSAGESNTFSHTKNANNKVALFSLILLFFMMGFITCLNDVLIPFLKNAFTLNYAQSMLIQFCFFMAYLVMSIPSGKLIELLGYKKAMIVGFVVAGIGCLLFLPAAQFREYILFLLALFILATGITLLQVAANPYVAVLGSPETASSRLTLTQAFNSLGTTLAPSFGSITILAFMVKPAAGEKLSASEIAQNLQAVQLPYLGLALVLFFIALVVFLLKLPSIRFEKTYKGTHKRASIWQFRHLILGTIGIFCYVGAEVAIGSFLISFMGEKSVAGLNEEIAGKYLTFYWGGAMVGRFIGAWVLQKFAPPKVLFFNACVAISLIIIGISNTGELAMYSLLAVGLFNSLMFSTIFTLAVAELKEFTTQGSGILCTAIVGGAVVPALQGVLADNVGLRWAFVLPILCYAYIAFFAKEGYKIKK